ncbi:hypothetical protein VTH82DRAFT_1137 [Thermothelomyces myriococcoides]
MQSGSCVKDIAESAETCANVFPVNRTWPIAADGK